MKQSVRKLFSPNAAISGRTFALLAAAQAIVVLAAWVAAPAGIFPRPAAVLCALRELWGSGELPRELAASLLLNLEALALALAVSLPLAWLSVVPFFRSVAFYVSKGRFLGMVGLTFVFMMLAGGGHLLKVLLLAFGMTVFLVTSLADMVAAIPGEEFDYARTLRMGEWRAVAEVAILGRADAALDLLRQVAAVGWTMLTMVEGLVRSEGGVGVLLLNDNRHFLLDRVFAIQFSILLVGLFQDWLIGRFKGWLCPYARLDRREAAQEV